MLPKNPTEALVRVEYDFHDRSERFVLMNAARNFTPQYASLYFARLEIMTSRVMEAAHIKWGGKFPQKKLSEIQENQDCIIVGTLYKEMELKPSILKEVSEDTEVPLQPILPRYASDSDTLLLEEESQRIVLTGSIDVSTIVTGVSIAILGAENSEGEFVVKEFCLVGIPAQPEYPILKMDCYVAFISGLNLGPKSTSLITMDLCVEMLTGQLGTEKQQSKMSKVAALIISGNLIDKATDEKPTNQTQKARYMSSHSSITGSVAGMKMLDDVLVQLTACMDVFVMPGAHDPGTFMMPQQSLHPCMFPLSNKSSGLHLTTNPFDADFNGVRLLGTSGQNISDIYKNSKIEDPLDSMEKTLTWSHIAPTAPDTLGCYPFTGIDPFILDSAPHIYFAGNQNVASARLVQGPNAQRVLLISLPAFSKLPTLTLVNLRSLEVERISFKDAIK